MNSPAARIPAINANGPSRNLSSKHLTGYSIVLPPGWQRIPLRQGTQAAIRDITKKASARLSRHIPSEQAISYRLCIEQGLAEATRKGLRAGGIDLYLPTELIHGVAVPASFIVSCGTHPAPTPVDHTQVIGRLMGSTEKSAPVIVDGITGLRTEGAVMAAPDQEADAATLRVDYILPLPGHIGWWLIVTFSTLSDGNPESEFAKLLAQLFDAIMLTFRWTSDTVREEQHDNGAR